ncbi:nuclear transport factor 2 family protein [bacterium]|nr:nuclear transport factor 2 family protein [bacterium]MBP9809573.1 nuclear transport factor 2 family protein [bacterium]
MKPVLSNISAISRLFLVSALTASSLVLTSPANALETSPAITLGSQDFTLDSDNKEHEKERKEIENTLSNIETLWNAHNLDGVMANYSDDYVNNDGLDKKAVTTLTQDFWKTYPDAKSVSKTKHVRIEGNFATIESRDMAVGTTSKEMPGMSSKGELQSLSEGQLYLKKIGSTWKIVGDRIDYEKVKVAFGLAKQLNAVFTAPEQVKAGKQYSAKLEVSLPPGLFAVGSITSQPLRFPQPSPSDSPRPLEAPALERVMSANNENRNELLTATVILTNPMRTSVMGVSFLTRRMNVIAEPLQNKDEIQVAESDSKLSRKHPVLEKKDENKPEEKKVEEKKLDEKKLEDQKVEEKKPEEKPQLEPTTAPVGESK